MTTPPKPQERKRVVVGICIAAVVGLIGFAWLAARLGLVQFGSPSFMVEKAWFSNGTV